MDYYSFYLQQVLRVRSVPSVQGSSLSSGSVGSGCARLITGSTLTDGTLGSTVTGEATGATDARVAVKTTGTLETCIFVLASRASRAGGSGQALEATGAWGPAGPRSPGLSEGPG